MKTFSKYIIIILVIVLTSLLSFGQDENAGGVPELTPEMRIKLDAIPEMTLSTISSTITLPQHVDNSQQDYMRPIFQQIGASCSQAAGIAYTYTYEINLLRNLPANNQQYEENWYPTHYTWNFLNDGLPGGGSWYVDGWDIVKESGCPNTNTWGGMFGTWQEWMTGYDKYLSGMYNRLDSYWYIDISTPEGLEVFKHWINDHNNGTDIGGLGCFVTYLGGYEYDQLPPESFDAGKPIMKLWDFSMEEFHAMTFVGYDDRVVYDINEDGEFTNHLDINDDQVIDMLDWEIGALKIANSYGDDDWPEGLPIVDGYCYLPYRLLPLELEDPNNPSNVIPVIFDKKTHVIKVTDEAPPLFAIKTGIDYTKRSRLTLKVGYAYNANQLAPVEDPVSYTSFSKDGGGLPMLGGPGGSEIELGLDFSYWYSSKDFGKIFFVVDESEPGSSGQGEIQYFSIIDYRWEEEFELNCDQSDVEILIDAETILSIDYDLIVPGDEQYIDENTNLFSNMVSRFNPTVTNGVTLTAEDGVEIDMYSSSLIINEGATLVIEDNVVFNGEDGECRIQVYGDIQVGQNVTFNNVDIAIYNSNNQTTFLNSTFNGSSLANRGSVLNITNSDFNACPPLWSLLGDVSITGSDFDCTWLILDNNLGDLTNTLTVSDNEFVGSSGCDAGIYISDYDYFNIEYNTLDNCGIGIQLYESGNGASGNQNIVENEIMNCDDKGILIYNSTAAIAGNNIHDNENGVWLANSSNVALYGNVNAQTYSETQQIKDNTLYEVYSSKHSFPWYFRHNAIIDNDNTGNPVDPLLYFDSPCTQQRDIRYNCWGTDFNESEDLYPSICFVYSPTWCPPGTIIEGGVAEQLYITANTLFETGNYAEAQDSYQSVIDLYPETEFAQASMRDLFSLEMFIGNDYAGLKQYYNTNTIVQSDSVLTELAVFFSNKCDVQLENWQAAIDHYESIINDPPTPEDSIYAIIDLGYTYILMQNSGYKSFYKGAMVEHIPASLEQFREKREYHLSLFPLKNDEVYETPSNAQVEGQLLQNIPNPFSYSTKIFYEMFSEGIAGISVYNHLGSEVWTTEKQNSTGKNSVEFNAGDLRAGIYYYMLLVNGKVADSKKMILVK